MKQNLKILVFVDYYLPGFRHGGPTRTIANIVEHLGSEYSFSIVARDRDPGMHSAYPGVIKNRWTARGDAAVFYMTPSVLSWIKLIRSVRKRQVDIIYLNSLFSPFSSIIPLLLVSIGALPRKAVIVAPRGELSPSALALRPYKKRQFLRVARLCALHRSVIWQASNLDEARLIERTLMVSGESIAIAPNLPSKALPKLAHVSKAASDALKIVFLSRVSPMKNLDYALSVVGRCTGPIEFSIFGPIGDAAYWKRCQALIRQMPEHIKISYGGEVAPSDVCTTLANFDLFILPTRGENYGHVIREALASGIPVLISDRTPWKNLAYEGVGADLSLDDPEAWVRWISEFTLLGPAARASMGMAASNKAGDLRAIEPDIDANRAMFRLAAGSKV